MTNKTNETVTNSLGHTEEEVIEFVGKFRQNAIDNLGYTEQDAVERGILLYTGIALQKYIELNSGKTDRLDERTKAMTRLEEVSNQLKLISDKYKK